MENNSNSFTLRLKNNTDKTLLDVDIFCPQRSIFTDDITLECLDDDKSLSDIYDHVSNLSLSVGMIFISCSNSRQLINSIHGKFRDGNDCIIETPFDLLHESNQFRDQGISLKCSISLDKYSVLTLRRLFPHEEILFRFVFSTNEGYQRPGQPFRVLIKNKNKNQILSTVISEDLLFSTKESHWNNDGNLVFDDGIEISSDVPNVTYRDLLYQVFNNPVHIDKTISFDLNYSITRENIEIIDMKSFSKEPKRLKFLDEDYMNLLPFMKVYNDKYVLGWSNTIRVNNIYPNSELLLKLYPSFEIK